MSKLSCGRVALAALFLLSGSPERGRCEDWINDPLFCIEAVMAEKVVFFDFLSKKSVCMDFKGNRLWDWDGLVLGPRTPDALVGIKTRKMTPQVPESVLQRQADSLADVLGVYAVNLETGQCRELVGAEASLPEAHPMSLKRNGGGLLYRLGKHGLRVVELHTGNWLWDAEVDYEDVARRNPSSNRFTLQPYALAGDLLFCGYDHSVPGKDRRVEDAGRIVFSRASGKRVDVPPRMPAFLLHIEPYVVTVSGDRLECWKGWTGEKVGPETKWGEWSPWIQNCSAHQGRLLLLRRDINNCLLHFLSVPGFEEVRTVRFKPHPTPRSPECVSSDCDFEIIGEKIVAGVFSLGTSRHRGPWGFSLWTGEEEWRPEYRGRNQVFPPAFGKVFFCDDQQVGFFEVATGVRKILVLRSLAEYESAVEKALKEGYGNTY